VDSRSLRLFLLCVAIWGTTWLAIRYQLGSVAPEVSVGYRFLLAAALATLIVRLRGQPIVPPRSAHGLLALFGLSTFTAGYIFVYYAETLITSGLVAVGYSLTPLLNHFAARLALRAPPNRSIELGGTLGAIGVALVFGPELARVSFSRELVLGGAFTLAAVLCSTVGTVLAKRLEQRSVGVWQRVAWSMAYGGAGCLAVSLVLGRELSFSWTPGYLISLGYLAAFGSVAAFAAYLTLFESIGVGRAGYVGVLVPVVALLVSTVFEGFQPTAWTALGLGFVLAGQAAVARRGS